MTWPEGISLVEGLVKEQERNIERAIIDEGTYELNKDFEHLKIDPERWLSLSEKEKLNRLSKVHGMKLTRMPSSAVTPCEDVEIPCEEGSAVNLTELATRPLPKEVGSKPGKAPPRKRTRSRDAPRRRETDDYTPTASGSGEFKFLFCLLYLTRKMLSEQQNSYSGNCISEAYVPIWLHLFTINVVGKALW